jgi:hypothetical protein
VLCTIRNTSFVSALLVLWFTWLANPAERGTASVPDSLLRRQQQYDSVRQKVAEAIKAVDPKVAAKLGIK